MAANFPERVEPYDPALAVPPSGLHNTGVICHFNSLIQALLGCTSFVRAVLGNAEFLSQTITGAALHTFVTNARAGAQPSSARLLDALARDLRVRMPHVQYGPSQESASEGLVLLLAMLDVPDEESDEESDEEPDGETVAKPREDARTNPISHLFYHRYREVVYCTRCKKKVSVFPDSGFQFELFHHDTHRPTTPDKYAGLIRSYITTIDDYACEKCGTRNPGYRHYLLRVAPEIIVSVFNQYATHRTRYVPDRFEFPGPDGTRISYRQVAQVDHRGSLAGGHYTARSLRRGGVFAFNDTNVAASAFAPTAGTYLVFHHFE